MMSRIIIAFVFYLFLAVFFLGTTYFDSRASAFDCLNLTSNSLTSEKQFCQNELNQLIKEQAELEAKLKEQSKQTGNLRGDINALTAQINALRAKIKTRSLKIAELKVDIKEKTSKISSLSKKIEREHESLAQLLRNTNDFDNKDFIYLVFSNEGISDFYSDLESYASIKEAVKNSVEEITGIKIETETEKKNLEEKHDAELDAKAELESAQKKVAKSEAEKKQLLNISKDKEASYQLLVAQKKARADKIRAALFELRDSKAIPFGVALEYAKLAEQKTGVRPAFLLAVITQESNLGSNTGSCYLTDFDKGVGISSKTGKIFSNVMHPTRDIPPFLDLSKALGFTPNKTLVSCPIGGFGYGGAMGPAQFIPSTWNLIKGRIAEALGNSTPNPWIPKDAFMASAFYLSDLGAGAQTYSSEIRAACKYYGSGGSSCSYGKSVMKKASGIQDNIDYILNNG